MTLDDDDGTVPWEMPALLEAVNWYSNLCRQSTEHWVLREPGPHCGDGTDQFHKWSIHPPGYRLEMYMTERYRHRPDEGRPLLNRVIQAIRFLYEYDDRLTKEPDFCRSGEDGKSTLPFALFQALAVLPYSRVVVEDDGAETRRFDYDEVIAMARTCANLDIPADTD